MWASFQLKRAVCTWLYEADFIDREEFIQYENGKKGAGDVADCRHRAVLHRLL